MKKIMLITALLICTGFGLVFADNVIKGPVPGKYPPSEKCSACHNIQQTYKEVSHSGHKDLKCFDCHLPGSVQKGKYERKDRSFYRLGYHKQNGKWEETTGNNVCLRCHKDKGITNTSEKCWSCHMPEDGIDEFVLVKDKKLPPTGDNIREIKKLPHKSHMFKIHLKGK